MQSIILDKPNEELGLYNILELPIIHTSWARIMQKLLNRSQSMLSPLPRSLKQILEFVDKLQRLNADDIIEDSNFCEFSENALVKVKFQSDIIRVSWQKFQNDEIKKQKDVVSFKTNQYDISISSFNLWDDSITGFILKQNSHANFFHIFSIRNFQKPQQIAAQNYRFVLPICTQPRMILLKDGAISQCYLIQNKNILQINKFEKLHYLRKKDRALLKNPQILFKSYRNDEIGVLTVCGGIYLIKENKIVFYFRAAMKITQIYHIYYNQIDNTQNFIIQHHKNNSYYFVSCKNEFNPQFSKGSARKLYPLLFLNSYFIQNVFKYKQFIVIVALNGEERIFCLQNDLKKEIRVWQIKSKVGKLLQSFIKMKQNKEPIDIVY